MPNQSIIPNQSIVQNQTSAFDSSGNFLGVEGANQSLVPTAQSTIPTQTAPTTSPTVAPMQFTPGTESSFTETFAGQPRTEQDVINFMKENNPDFFQDVNLSSYEPMTDNQELYSMGQGGVSYADILGEFRGAYDTATSEYRNLLRKSQQETDLGNQLADLRNQANLFKQSYQAGLDAIEDRVVPLEVQVGEQAALGRQASRSMQQYIDMEANLLNRLGLAQEARQAEMAYAQQGVSDLMTNFGLQLQVQDRIAQQDSEMFSRAMALRQDAQNILGNIVSSFAGFSFGDLDNNSKLKIQQLANQAGIPFDVLVSGMDVVKNQMDFNKMLEMAKLQSSQASQTISNSDILALGKQLYESGEYGSIAEAYNEAGRMLGGGFGGGFELGEQVGEINGLPAYDTYATNPGVNRSDRNNNPGNIKLSDFSKNFAGVVGVESRQALDGGNFLIFDSPESGINAIGELLLQGRAYQGKTAEQAIKAYNGSGGYGATDVGLNPNQDFQSQIKDQNKRFQVAMSIAKLEGYTGGTATTKIDPMTMAQAREMANKLAPRSLNDKAFLNMLARKIQENGYDATADELRYSGQSEKYADFRKIAGAALTNTPPTQRKMIEDILDDYIESDDLLGARDYILKIARENAIGVEAKYVNGREDALYALNEIEALLKEYEANGGRTNLLTGNIEKFQNNVLKKTGSAKLAGIANQIAIVIQKYRQELTGAAFTESEAEEYAGLFPSIEKTPELNMAKIQSMRNAYNGYINQFYRRQLGGINNWNKLQELTQEFNWGGDSFKTSSNIDDLVAQFGGQQVLQSPAFNSLGQRNF
jgi:hypothetical protein